MTRATVVVILAAWVVIGFWFGVAFGRFVAGRSPKPQPEPQQHEWPTYCPVCKGRCKA